VSPTAVWSAHSIGDLHLCGVFNRQSAVLLFHQPPSLAPAGLEHLAEQLTALLVR
jgi:hypothetical protein